MMEKIQVIFIGMYYVEYTDVDWGNYDDWEIEFLIVS
jgi:hypothetical protein